MSFEATLDLSGRLPLRQTPLCVRPRLVVIGETGEHDGVQSPVELTVASSVQAVADDLTGRGRDGSHAGQGGEGRLGA
jgi:hypothetical protein